MDRQPTLIFAPTLFRLQKSAHAPALNSDGVAEGLDGLPWVRWRLLPLGIKESNVCIEHDQEGPSEPASVPTRDPGAGRPDGTRGPQGVGPKPRCGDPGGGSAGPRLRDPA